MGTYEIDCRLAYNPITLEYDRNPEGEKLKHRD